MPDPNYPTGALEALIAIILARGPHDLLVDRKEAHALLDALAAMSPEDRAALARWVWPEGHELMATRVRVALDAGEKDCAVLRKRLVEAEAATIKRITDWLFEVEFVGEDGDPGGLAARAILLKFGGGPDAAK